MKFWKTLKDVANPEPEDEANTSEKDKFELYDLSRPLEGDCNLELLDFEDPLGATVIYNRILKEKGNEWIYYF